VTSITGHGLGGLATLSAVGSTEITNDSITDADINASAAIAQSKISGLSTSLSGKEPTITAGTTAQFYRGDKSWQTFDSTARAAFSITAPLTYNSGTGVFGLGQSSGVADGYLSSSDFTVFNNKQAAITAASTLNTGSLTSALQNGVQIKPYGVAAGNAGELRFNELAAGGTNYVGIKAPDTLAGDKIWTLPAADGTSGQVLKTDGSGILSWVSVGTGNMLGSNNLSDITVPATARTNLGLGALATLGAVGSTQITDDSIVDADINASAAIADTKLATISAAGKVSGSAITSGTIAGSTIINSTGAITTTGTVTATGNYVVYGTGAASTELRFNDNDNTNYVGFKSSGVVAANKIWTLPAADGTSGQVLSTDGSGTLSWAASGVGLTSCPSGFTMIGMTGKRGTFCIDTNERTAATWLTAKSTCRDLDLAEGKAFMCIHNEWYDACLTGTPTGMTGGWEWVAEFNNDYGDANAIQAGSSSCESLSSDNMNNTKVFRCCVR
jgi:hypothetical protein